MITRTLQLAVTAGFALTVLAACSDQATPAANKADKPTAADKADSSKAGQADAGVKGAKSGSLPTTQAPELKFSEADIANHKEAARAAAVRALEIERAKQAARASKEKHGT